MIRQGLRVSVDELRELADDLERQTRQFNLELDEDEIVGFDKRWQINIINKTPECSDTWEIEELEEETFNSIDHKQLIPIKKTIEI